MHCYLQVAASQRRNVELEAQLAAAMEGSTAAIRQSPSSGMLDQGDSGLPALKQGQSSRHELVLEAAKARLGLSPERSGAHRERDEGDSVVRELGRAVWTCNPASEHIGKPPFNTVLPPLQCCLQAPKRRGKLVMLPTAGCFRSKQSSNAKQQQSLLGCRRGRQGRPCSARPIPEEAAPAISLPLGAPCAKLGGRVTAMLAPSVPTSSRGLR